MISSIVGLSSGVIRRQLLATKNSFWSNSHLIGFAKLFDLKTRSRASLFGAGVLL